MTEYFLLPRQTSGLEAVSQIFGCLDMIYSSVMIFSSLEEITNSTFQWQANTYDGVHMDMKGNLVKAMMVMNWLNLLPGTNS